MDIPIIYEDDNMLAVNKPAGLVVHSDGRTKESTLADWFLEKYPDAKDVGEPIVLPDGAEIKRPGIVHRLDRDTSGVIVMAKNQKSFEFLKKQFQERHVQKTYRAILSGILKEKSGVIDIPIGKSKKDFRRWLADENARGTLREAITEFKVLGMGDNATYVEVYPKTGRTHQIRVHFKAVGHPVLCDSLYGTKKDCFLEMDRQALHAWQITLKDMNNVTLTIEAPLPKDFQGALSELGVRQ